MQDIIINWWAVLVGAVALNILGFIWYGPIFGKTWGQIVGLRPESEMSKEENRSFRKKMMPVYWLNFGLSVLMAHFFMHFMAGWNDGNPVLNGVFSSLRLWIGIIIPVLAANSMWSNKPKNIAWKMFFVNAGYYLVAFVILGIIFGLWQ